MTRSVRRRSISWNRRSARDEPSVRSHRDTISMTGQHSKTQVRLRNGDVLIVPTAERDAKVDAAFKAALRQLRERNAERIVAFRRARRAAA